MKRIVHLTSAHSPDDVRISQKQCASLVNAGYQVDLVAPQGSTASIPAGITTHLIPKAQTRFERWFTSIAQIYSMAKQLHADAYHFHDPELITVGFLLFLRGKKVIYDVHEDLPLQIASKGWIPPRLRVPIAALAKVAEGGASTFLSQIVAATPSIATRFPQTKTITVQNFPSLSDLGVKELIPYDDRPKWVGYIGGISRIRGIMEFVEAAKLVSSVPDVQFKLAGSINPADFEQELRRLEGWPNVDYMGWLDRAAISNLLQQLRVGIVTLHPRPNYLESYPVKMFEYMAAGVPVVASDFPLWRKIVEESKCGLLVDPLNPQAIAEAVKYLIDNPLEAKEMGLAGRKAVLQRFSWENEAKKLVEGYKSLLGS